MGGDRMKAILEQKQKIVDEIADVITQSEFSAIINCQGTVVSEIDAIRKELFNSSFSMRVYKNTLIKRALEKTGYELPQKALFGFSAIMSAKENGLALSKLLAKYNKNSNSFTIKAGVFENQVCDTKQIQELAKLASMEELIAKLLMLLQAPITGFVQGVSAPLKKFVYTLDGISKK